MGRCSRIRRRDEELRGVLALERTLAADQLDQDEREGEHVRPGSGGPEAARELLRRAVVGGECLQRSPRDLEGSGHAGRLGDDLGDAEVQDLDGLPAADLGEKQVGRFHVAVRDALFVSQIEGSRDGVEQSERFGEGPSPSSQLVPLVHVPLEGPTLEPLEHQIGSPVPGRRGRRADVEGLHDASGHPRQAVLQLAFVQEALEEAILVLALEVLGDPQAFEGDLLAEAQVVGAVHDRKATFSDALFDDVLGVRGGAHPPKRITRSAGHSAGSIAPNLPVPLGEIRTTVRA